jgi:DNA-binding FrmR family transcriptional regulator
MAHIAGAKTKRLNRLRRVKGQNKAIEQTVASRPRLRPRHRKSAPAEAPWTA